MNLIIKTNNSEHKSLAYELEYWEFLDDNKILFVDGSIGTAVELKGIDVDTWDVNDINNFTISLRDFVNDLDENLFLQILVKKDCDNSKILNEYVKPHASPLANALNQAKIEFLKSQSENKELFSPRIFLFIRKYYGGEFLPKTNIFSSIKTFQESTIESHQKKMGQFQNSLDSISYKLGDLGLSPRNLHKQELSDIIFKFLNPKQTPPQIKDIDFNGTPSIREYYARSSVVHRYEYLLSDDTYHKIVSLKILPSQTHASMMRTLLNLPIPFELIVNVAVPFNSKEISKLERERKFTHSMAAENKSGLSDIESETKYADIQSLLEDLHSMEQKLFFFSLHVLLRDADLETVEQYSQLVIQALSSFSSAIPNREDVALFDIYKTLAPFGSCKNVYLRRLPTHNLADFLPVFSSADGHAEPVVLLHTHTNQLFKFNPFDPSLPSFNQVVSGQSGSGKSFLNNLILLQLLPFNPIIQIIDIGGSYKKLTKIFEGQYCEINLDSPWNLNPFDLNSGEFLPNPNKLKSILSLIEIILAEVEQPKLSKFERALLERAIIETYKRVPKPILSDLKETLQKSEEKRLNDFAKILYSWTGDSPYGKFLDRPTNINFKSDVVTFDLKGLSNNPDLQSAIILILTDHIWNVVQNNPHRKKIIIMDEVWKLIDSASGFIEEVFRTFRKYGASAIAITQSIEDISKSKISSAILNNAPIRWLLNQKTDTEVIKNALQLNDAAVGWVGHLKQRRGVYSEVLLSMPNSTIPIRVYPTPLEYWIATTDFRDNQLLDGKLDLETLKKMAIEYPNGAV